jgi:hypothetical protein
MLEIPPAKPRAPKTLYEETKSSCKEMAFEGSCKEIVSVKKKGEDEAR